MSQWQEDKWAFSAFDDDPNEEDELHWPDYVEKGFEFIYGEYIPPYEVEAFRTRWGGLERETFIRVLSEGRGQDRLLAMCVLGESHLLQSPVLLRPFLHSSDDQERWVSAITLGRLKDEASLPELAHLLTEFLPTAEAPYSRDDSRYRWNDWRIAVAITLQRWDDRRHVSVVRRALMSSIRAEAYNPFSKELWFTFQDVLIATLGRYRSFGALTGLVLSPARLQLAIVTLAAGACPPDYDIPTLVIPQWESDEQFRREITKVLGEQFGLSAEEQDHTLANYTRNWNLRRHE